MILSLGFDSQKEKKKRKEAKDIFSYKIRWFYLSSVLLKPVVLLAVTVFMNLEHESNDE